MPYQDAMSMLLLDRGADNGEEAAFVSSWKEFIATMGQAKPLDEGSSLSLKTYCSRLLSSAKGLEPLGFFATLDGALYTAGLWPIKLRNSDQQVAENILKGDVDSFIGALLRTPLYDNAYIESLRPLSKEEVCDFLRNNVLSMGEVDAVFLKGSFAMGSYRLDSDIDIGLVFSEGHGEEEKRAVVDAVQEASLKMLSRMMDVKEYLRDDNGTLVASDGVMEEVAP